MLKAFFSACGRSLLHGPIVAAAAFPLGLLMIAIFVLLLTTVPLIFLIPFVGMIITFTLSLIVWTFAARFAGSLAGLGLNGRTPSFTSALWAALPVVFVIKITLALFAAGINFAAMELSVAGDTETAGSVLGVGRAIADAVTGLETLLIVIFIVPACCEVPTRAGSLHTIPLLLGRFALAALAAFALAAFAAEPLRWVIDLIREGGLLGLDETEVMSVVTAPAFYLGSLTWLLAGILLAFEANLHARAPRRAAPAENAEFTASSAREIRAAWNRRDGGES